MALSLSLALVLALTQAVALALSLALSLTLALGRALTYNSNLEHLRVVAVRVGGATGVGTSVCSCHHPDLQHRPQRPATTALTH